MSRRSAYTLIETLVVMTLLAAILIPVSAVMHTLYQSDHRVQADLTRNRSVERLREQLRLDAHQATAAQIESAPSTGALSLKLPNGETARYAPISGGLERTVVVENNVKRREAFLLPGTSTFTWTVSDADDSRLVSLQIHVESARPATRNTYTLEAALRLLP